MRRSAPRLLARLAGVAAASGLAIVGLVVVASPASAAACSGSSGVTAVVDTGSSISTRCAAGDYGSAMGALKGAGFDVKYPQRYPGAVVCRIDGHPAPASDPCVGMPPGNAYWAFFHANRGGSWVYSSSGVATYDPAPGTVVGFRFGSGQQPGIAPPSPPRTSAPAPTKPTPKPAPRPARKPAPSKAKPTTPAATSASGTTATSGSSPSAGVKGQASGSPSATPTASATASASAKATATAAPSPSETASDLAAAPTSLDADDGGGPGAFLAGGALVALVAGGAGWAAWKRRV